MSQVLKSEKFRNVLAAAAMLLGLSCGAAVAQDNGGDAAAASTSAAASSPTDPQATAPADGPSSGQSQSARSGQSPVGLGSELGWPFQGMMPQHWSLKLGSQVTNAYDSNVLMTSSAHEMDSVSRISATGTLSYLGKRARWWGNYMPDFGVYARYNNLNFVQQSFSQRLEYQLPGHMEFQWFTDASITPSRAGSSFAAGNFGSAVLGQSTLGRSLDSDTTTIHNSFGLTKKLSGRTRIELEASGTATKSTPGKNSVLATSHRDYSSTGRLTLDHDLTATQGVGFVLTDTYFLFLHTDHQHFQAAQASYRRDFGRAWRLALAGGPSFTETRGGNSQPDTHLGFAFDSSMTYLQKRNQFVLSLSRFAHASSLAGQVDSWTTTFRAGRQLSRRWSVMSLAQYSRTESNLNLLTRGTEIYSGTLHLSYQFQPNLSWVFNYGYTDEHGGYLPLGAIDKHQVAVGFVYQLNAETGR